MAPLVVGLGYDWAIEQTAKCIDELVALIHPGAGGDTGNLFDAADPRPVNETAAHAAGPSRSPASQATASITSTTGASTPS